MCIRQHYLVKVLLPLPLGRELVKIITQGFSQNKFWLKPIQAIYFFYQP
jgi:hypothetical protein